ncbi:MAG: T9SS type B sorting domain-containing protein [Polaribacter sp.]|uniref:T9SS type B sorting domain-containing protein n=1 Tax=Polaribacter sp. TaxID=1920175 RepID=UPI003BAE797A
MKKAIFLLLLSLWFSRYYSQCPPPGTVTLASQTDVNEFAANYGTCNVITGDVIILSGFVQDNSEVFSEITDLTPLNFLKNVNGNLKITANINELIGFNNLIQVRGDLEITNCKFLKSISGFNKLQFAHDVVIALNPVLERVEGFKEIETITFSLKIGFGDQLKEVSGFENLKIIKEELNISENPFLTKVPSFNNLIEIVDDLNFTSNPSLNLIDGFNELISIGNDLNIEATKVISGFNKLERIGNYFDLRGLGMEEIPSFNNLEEVGAGFRIANTDIKSINGFNKLLKVGNINFLEDWFILSNNSKLNQVTGFGSFIFVDGNLEVKNNILLQNCSWLCNIINNGEITKDLIIQNNLGDCLTAAKIIEICDPDFDDDGVADVIDFDDDNDGILDTVEGNGITDSDNDGFPDSKDLDSDNDGCFDVIEAGFEDQNSDGILGDLPNNVDINGLITNEATGYTTPTDKNNNGIFDFQEASNTDPGSNGLVQLCLNSPIKDLFTVLNGNPDRGGSWVPSLASGSGEFNPLKDKPGVYTYIHSDPTCGQRSAQVLVDIPSTLTAGEDTEVVFCNQITQVDLFNFIEGNPSKGGYWAPQLESTTNIFNPQRDLNTEYTYTVIDDFCGEISSKITVKNITKPNAGIGTKIQVCEYVPSFSLFDLLEGNPDANGTWFPSLPNGIFDPSLNVSGNYSYTIDNGACGSETSIVEVEVLTNSSLNNVSIKVNDFSSKNNSIQVLVFSDREYEYSIDGFNYQIENIFNQIKGGEQTVYIRGVDGCEYYTETVFVKSYPGFFTPNNDGSNDVWRLKDFPDVNYTIYIYNRYGKLIKEFKSSSGFWDGTYQGKNVQSSNYYFKVVTETGEVLHGNFSLLRK